MQPGTVRTLHPFGAPVILAIMEQQPQREPGFKAWVKYVWAEGLARRVIVEKGDEAIVRLPLTVVIIGAAVAPWLAAAGLVVAVVTGCRLAVERPVSAPPAPAAPPEPPPPPAETAPTSEDQPGASTI